MKTQSQIRLRTLTECALLIALATALSFVKVWQAPLGGSVTLLSTLPIMYISIRHGIIKGLSCGFVYSLIQLWQGSGNLAYVPTTAGVVGCILLDYILPFTFLGMAGVFCPNVQKIRRFEAVVGFIASTVLCFVCPFIGGGALWSRLACSEQSKDDVNKNSVWSKIFGNDRVNVYKVLAGVIVATLLRFVCHFIGGGIVWYEITKAGQWNDYVQSVGMWTYSFVYNIAYVGPDGAMAIVASTALPALEKALKKAGL